MLELIKAILRLLRNLSQDVKELKKVYPDDGSIERMGGTIETMRDKAAQLTEKILDQSDDVF